MKDQDHFTSQRKVRPVWRRFVDEITPYRSDLFRYCCGLTGDVWDAEDLVQDVLARVFSLMGRTNMEFRHPRAYLIRAATRLWIDRRRQQKRERSLISELAEETPKPPEATPADPLALRNAVATLFAALPPQERVAILLKDVLDFSLKEAASLMHTSEGAVKSALHRGRTRLGASTEQVPTAPHGAPRAIVERFVSALSNRRLDELQSLCREDVTIDMVGGARFESFDEGRAVFQHAHLSIPGLGMGAKPRWSIAEFNGELVVIGYRTRDGVEGVNEVWRLAATNGGIDLVRLYCFSPDVVSFVARQLGLPALERPYRSPM